MKLHKRTLAQIVDMSWQLHGSRREAASTSLSQALHYTGKSRSLGDCPGKKLGVSYASLTGSFSASFGCFGFISDIREKKGLIRASFGSFGLFFKQSLKLGLHLVASLGLTRIFILGASFGSCFVASYSFSLSQSFIRCFTRFNSDFHSMFQSELHSTALFKSFTRIFSQYISSKASFTCSVQSFIRYFQSTLLLLLHSDASLNVSFEFPSIDSSKLIYTMHRGYSGNLRPWG